MFMLLCFHFDLGLLLLCRVPPTTSESGKNASGQEAFGSKAREALMEQSPAVSTANVTSSVIGAGVMAASAEEKAGANTAPPAEGEKDDLCMTDPRPTLDPQTVEVGGARVEDDAHWFLYVGTPWEEEVTADHRDVENFKEASCMIGRVLSVRSPVLVLEILFLSLGVLQGLISRFVCSCCSHLPNGRRHW
jgi:hypothetical protein